MQDMSIRQLRAQEIAIRLKIEKVTMESHLAQEAMREMRSSRSQQQEIVLNPDETDMLENPVEASWQGRHVEAEMQL